MRAPGAAPNLCKADSGLSAMPVIGHGILVAIFKLRRIYPSTLDTYPFPNPLQHVNTVTMSELITTSSAYIINGDSPMTSVANTVAMTTLAVHTLQPLIFYNHSTIAVRAFWIMFVRVIMFARVT